MMRAVLNWANGWRRDMDGWLVRARRETDPAHLPPHVGFVEEACICVRTSSLARYLDKRRDKRNARSNP